MEFAEVPWCQFGPTLNFSPAETEIIDAEISKLLSKGIMIMFPAFLRGPKKLVIIG